ncbi:hypothetical protein NPIL_386761 [Nephila pilipes]|uniref:Uncharacterized protein n=1 Tax=Nephila pilipes TaxID=299642 RepID=A0A8X6U7P1_NEPPI|nr:hypothetical protein NPIL_386761 [Nephila pilipes]
MTNSGLPVFINRNRVTTVAGDDPHCLPRRDEPASSDAGRAAEMRRRNKATAVQVLAQRGEIADRSTRCREQRKDNGFHHIFLVSGGSLITFLIFKSN